jgi:hypothetical protein
MKKNVLKNAYMAAAEEDIDSLLDDLASREHLKKLAQNKPNTPDTSWNNELLYPSAKKWKSAAKIGAGIALFTVVILLLEKPNYLVKDTALSSYFIVENTDYPALATAYSDSVIVTTNIENNPVYSSFLNDFDNANYTAVLTKLTPALVKAESNPEVNYSLKTYLAVSYFKTKQYEKALPILKNIAKRQDGVYKDKLNFYLALTQLQTKQHEIALANLSILVNDENAPSNLRYHAQNILKKLQKQQ